MTERAPPRILKKCIQHAAFQRINGKRTNEAIFNAEEGAKRAMAASLNLGGGIVDGFPSRAVRSALLMEQAPG